MPEWNGEGRHPILGMTREEIIARSKDISVQQADLKVENAEKTPTPDAEAEARINAQQATEKQAQFIEAIATTLTKPQS